MTRDQLALRIETLQKELSYHQSISTNCSTCLHADNDFCLMWDVQPPPDVAKDGCQDWEFDNVPF